MRKKLIDFLVYLSFIFSIWLMILNLCSDYINSLMRNHKIMTTIFFLLILGVGIVERARKGVKAVVILVVKAVVRLVAMILLYLFMIVLLLGLIGFFYQLTWILNQKLIFEVILVVLIFIILYQFFKENICEVSKFITCNKRTVHNISYIVMVLIAIFGGFIPIFTSITEIQKLYFYLLVTLGINNILDTVRLKIESEYNSKEFSTYFFNLKIFFNAVLFFMNAFICFNDYLLGFLNVCIPFLFIMFGYEIIVQYVHDSEKTQKETKKSNLKDE